MWISDQAILLLVGFSPIMAPLWVATAELRSTTLSPEAMTGVEYPFTQYGHTASMRSNRLQDRHFRVAQESFETSVERHQVAADCPHRGRNPGIRDGVRGKR
jgi:hypothetical protein